MATGNSCELILALDLPDKIQALNLLDRIDNELTWVKVGLQMFTRWGPDLLNEVADRGYKIFLDLKLHDISNTVASTIESLSKCPVEMMTLHSLGGPEMINAAKEMRNSCGSQVKLIAVTVLTSHDESTLDAIGLNGPIPKRVPALAEMAVASGADGLVCSPLEVVPLREKLGSESLLITPGIRPIGSAVGDQKRIMTPAEAACAGSSFIVVGRPILQAQDPKKAALAIQTELASQRNNG